MVRSESLKRRGRHTMFLRFMLIIITAMSSFLSLYGCDFVAEQDIKELAEKVYISPDQIVLTHENIFLLTDTGVQLVQSLAWDENGLYVTQIANNRGTLCGHGYGCRICKGCIKPLCWNYCSGCH